MNVEKVKTVLSPIAPQNFKSVGGFLGRRFHANRTVRLNDPVLAEELLGPALRVRGSIQTRAPIFVTTQGNAKLPAQEEKDFVLLPFANQGAVQGEYGVFLRYR